MSKHQRYPEMVYGRRIDEILTRTSPEKKRAPAAEKWGKVDSERSCDAKKKLTEGFSSRDQQVPGDALKRRRAHRERRWHEGGDGAGSGAAEKLSGEPRATRHERDRDKAKRKGYEPWSREESLGGRLPERR